MTRTSEGRERPLARHRRPDGTSDETVAAVGKLSAALEIVEQARGYLYAFHRLCGSADLTLGEAVDELRAAGHDEQADVLERDLIGRNILEGRWSFQVVEEYDDTYWSVFRELENRVRTDLMDGRRHVYEAEMKEDRRSHGRRHHESVPDDSGEQSPPTWPTSAGSHARTVASSPRRRDPTSAGWTHPAP